MFPTLWKYFWNEYGILKLLLTVICCFLLFEEFIKYIHKKPTLTQTGRRKLAKEDFPVITLCPVPQIDLMKMNSYGYNSFYQYKMGMFNNETLSTIVGWSGNQTFKTTNDVITEIAVVKHKDDCPHSKWSYVEHTDGRSRKELLDFKLTGAIFPNHQCCQVIIPELSKSKVINSVLISLIPKDKPYHSFHLFLSDQTSYTIYQPASDQIRGQYYSNFRNETTTEYLKIQITKENHLEDDPNYECVDYKKPGEYNSCLENQLTEKIMETLNCTPPWITEKKVKQH